MQKTSLPLSFLYTALVLVSFGCQQKTTEPYVAIDPDETPLTHTFLPLPDKVIAPNDNTTTPEKVKLGKLLFFDPILSGNKDVACATCHHPEFGYAEFRDISIGVNGTGMSSKRIFNTPNDIPFVKRNAHTILNTAYNGMTKEGNYNPKKAPMFWDSRSNNLEEQALEPIKSLEEMRGRKYDEDNILPEILRRLNCRFRKNVSH